MALFNLLPKEEQYFSLFTQMTSFVYDAANALKQMLDDKSGDYTGHVARIKSIEHACDDTIHTVVTRLNKSFITPFDREDIYQLSGALDDIVDLIEASARAMLMYDLHESTPHARHFADVLQRMAIQLHEIVSMLSRPNGITPRLVELHRLENEGDDIYNAAIAELFRKSHDPLTVIKWKDIYEKLEAAVDRCEAVANIIESVIIKNA
jgi:predicted phosphate transport protein (TIGR00153 family)